MNRWIEFFEGEGNRLSMSRLLVFLAFFPSTIITTQIKTEAALSIYLGAYVINYGLGKLGDVLTQNGRKNGNNHNPAE